MSESGGLTATTRLRRLDAVSGRRAVPWYDLELAEAAAMGGVSGLSVTQVAGLSPITLPDVARLALQREPKAAVIAADSETVGAAWLLSALLTRRGVPTTVETRQLGTGNEATGYCSSAFGEALGLPAPDGPSPYRHAVTPPGAAPHIGVRAGWRLPGGGEVVRELDEVAADLDWLDGQATRPLAVALVGWDLWVRRDGAAAFRILPWDRWRRLRLAWPVTLDRAEEAVAAGAVPDPGELRVVVPAVPGAGERLRALVAAAGRDGVALATAVAYDLPDRAGVDAVREVARADPQVSVSGGEEALTALEDDGAAADTNPTGQWYRDRQTSRRMDRVLLSRLRSGRYEPLPAVAEAAAEVWWEHPDEPWAHGEWLAQVLGTGGLLVSAGGAGGAGGVGSPADSVWQGHARTLTLAVSDRGADGRLLDAGWLRLSERPYRLGRAEYPSEPVVLRLDDPADLEAFCRDLDGMAGGGGGAFPPGLLHPLSLLGDVCAVGAVACAGRGPARLFIDAEGIRTGPSASLIGEVGDPWTSLRAAARAAARNPLRCSCIPRAWPTDAARRLAACPWTPRVLAAKAAIKTLWPSLPQASASERLRAVEVLGLGAGVDGGQTNAVWPQGVGLVAVGKQSVLHETSSGRTLALSRPGGVLVEALLAGGAEHARELALSLVGSPQRAGTALEGAADALRRIGVTLAGDVN